MKLQYLAQVQKLLEEYDFQDKYRVMLDLEEELSQMEANGRLTKENIFKEIGAPADFVNAVIGTFDLTKLSEQNAASTIIEDTDELMSVTHTNLETGTSTVNLDDMEIKPVEDNPSDDSSNQSATNSSSDASSSSNPDSSKKHDHSNILHHEHAHQKQEKYKKQKLPFKIIFGILLTIFFILAFLITAVAIIVCVGLVVFLDAQTGISLLLGIISGLFAIGLFLSVLKQIIYSIIEKNLKTIRFIFKIIFMLLFAFLSKIMLSSSLETLGMYVSNNITSLQILFASLGVDISTVDWTNLRLSDFVGLFGSLLNSVL